MDFPSGFTERIKNQGSIDSDALLKSLRTPAPVSIRLNPLKWNKKPSRGERVPWCNDGWYLEQRPSYTLDPLFHAGCYYPQEASGMFAGEAFRQVAKDRSGIRVLDLCGAPGGKSTHLSAILGNSGVLVSNEVIKPRATMLAGNITRWGTANTIVTNNDPSSFSRLTGYFDIILADVPCSGEGMFRDEIAIKEWSAGNALLCSERQRRIIKDIWPSLREGGFLIYSTCTFNPLENEENIKWLTGNCQCENVNLDIGPFWGIHRIEQKGIIGYAFYPDKIKGEGFFLSVVRKTGKSVELDNYRKNRKHGVVSKEEIKAARDLLKSDIPLLIRQNDELIAVPLEQDEFTRLDQGLNIIRKGTEICRLKRDDLVPSHELIYSELLATGAFHEAELEYPDAIRFLRRESLKPGGLPEGWIIVTYRGVKIGLIKNIGQRINNYFPVSWRIRMQDVPDLNKIISWID